nr:PREDICTED: transmembrane channel-like protein 4 [Latimeria chalumnae]|eukprot:XP_014346664.1 PREDICTED: transmembrane channel-like protein 4 [Latimeria chalumnae]
MFEPCQEVIFNGGVQRESLRYRGSSAPHNVSAEPVIYVEEAENRETQDQDGYWLEDDSRPLKEIPLPMQGKRAVRDRRQMKIQIISSWESWKKSHLKSLKRFQLEAADVLSRMEVWKSSLHKIEGQFGTGIQSYFNFLRFLVMLNFAMFLLTAAVLVIPNIVFMTVDLQGWTLLNTTESGNCSLYNPTQEGLVSFYTYIMDLLSGTGFLELSYLFYGYYKDTDVGLTTAFSYNIPLAYLLTSLFYLLVSLIWLVRRSVQGFKLNLVSSDEALTNYSNKVFAGWDFCIIQEKATQLKHNSIHYELQMDLEEEAIREKIAEWTTRQKFCIYSLRLLLNLLVIGLLGASFFCIYIATQYSQILLNQDSVASSNFFLSLLVQYLPSIVITAANFTMPILFNIIIGIEKYSRTTEIKLTLLRSVFLRLASLGMLLFSLWTEITCAGDMDESDCSGCHYNYRRYPCWETRIGQEMYKLIIFDFITIVVVMLLVDFPRKILVQHCSCKPVQLWGQQEFLVPQNVLDIVYGQTICWIGTFYSPLLPLLNTVKYFIIFYLKKLTLFVNCRPANRTFRASSSNFFFLVVLLMGLILSCVPVLYSIMVITPSKGCGPFRTQQKIWDILPNSIEGLPRVTREFLFFIGSQAFAVPLFVLSCILLFYVVSLAGAYGQRVNLLKAQLQREEQDKHFLVKQIAEMGRANQKRANQGGLSGSVWDATARRAD